MTGVQTCALPIYMLTIREYKKVQSLEEAWELNQKRANRVIGGMIWMRLGEERTKELIHLMNRYTEIMQEENQNRKRKKQEEKHEANL